MTRTALLCFLAFLISCGRIDRTAPIQALQPNAEPSLTIQNSSEDSSFFPTNLPIDRIQPWEELDDNGNVVSHLSNQDRDTSWINSETIFLLGIESFRRAGQVSDFDEASQVRSGEVGSQELSYVIYRIPLAGAEPGVITADLNSRLRSDGSKSAYWFAISNYSENRWEWFGSIDYPHARFNIGDSVRSGTTYTSSFGNLFIVIAAYDGADIDIVGVGVNPYNAADTTAPSIPETPSLSMHSNGVNVDWTGLPISDFAGYQLYYSSGSFSSGTEPNVKKLDFLVQRPSFFLSGIKSSPSLNVRLAAVDTSGNESQLSFSESGTFFNLQRGNQLS